LHYLQILQNLYFSKYSAALERHIADSRRLQLADYREKVKADIEKENENLKNRERQQKEAAQVWHHQQKNTRQDK